MEWIAEFPEHYKSLSHWGMFYHEPMIEMDYYKYHRTDYPYGGDRITWKDDYGE